MKKIINDPETVVHEMIEGMVAAHPDRLKRIEGTSVLVRSTPKQGKVAIVSGGGSGHEPAHAGYVGSGMLDAAVSGEVFTSPTPDQVFEAIQAVDAGKGVLLVVKNYSGDVMNFEMAADLAENAGIHTETVIVNDDVAVGDESNRRGIAGTVFVHKIAGALAEQGASLEEVKNVAEKVIAGVRSMGMSLTPCTVPEVGKPGFEIADDEMEIGMGIHGEQGIERTKVTRADEIAEVLVSKVVDDLPFNSGDTVAVMVNGLGATPLTELYILNRKVSELLKEKEINVAFTFIGEFMTSLEMAGCSVSLLKLDNELKALLAAPADTVAWRNLE